MPQCICDSLIISEAIGPLFPKLVYCLFLEIFQNAEIQNRLDQAKLPDIYIK